MRKYFEKFKIMVEIEIILPVYTLYVCGTDLFVWMHMYTHEEPCQEKLGQSIIGRFRYV